MASMVGGLDLHRRQITFEVADVESAELWRAKLWQPDRQRFRRWLNQEVATRAKGGQVDLAVEGCTGWRFVVEEITAAGYVAHLAEPAESLTTPTTAARSPGRDRPQQTPGSRGRKLPTPACLPALCVNL